MRISKWKQFKIMSNEKEIAPFLPKTDRFNESSLWRTIDEFSQAIIKPSWGRLGRKVIQISVLDDEQLEIHSEYNKVTLTNRRETYEYLIQNFIRRRFIVQQKIQLATIQDCPFDLRVMVHRRRNSEDWAVTGKLAKVHIMVISLQMLQKLYYPYKLQFKTRVYNPFHSKIN